MLDRAIRSLALAGRRISAFHVVTLIAFTLLVFAWLSPAGHVLATTAHPVRPAEKGRAAAVSPDVSGLDVLRREAANGAEFSNHQLTIALLDRYDVAGNPDDLYEALEWMDRRWDISEEPALVGRVVANYCAQRVVQWHHLCVSGE